MFYKNAPNNPSERGRLPNTSNTLQRYRVTASAAAAAFYTWTSASSCHRRRHIASLQNIVISLVTPALRPYRHEYTLSCPIPPTSSFSSSSSTTRRKYYKYYAIRDIIPRQKHVAVTSSAVILKDKNNNPLLHLHYANIAATRCINYHYHYVKIVSPLSDSERSENLLVLQ